MKMRFKGGDGIVKPKDFNGEEINVGDILTHCWFDGDYVKFFHKHKISTDLTVIEKRVHEPSVIVKFNSERSFFFGEGIDGSKLYMHDFRFRYTKKVK